MQFNCLQNSQKKISAKIKRIIYIKEFLLEEIEINTSQKILCFSLKLFKSIHSYYFALPFARNRNNNIHEWLLASNIVRDALYKIIQHFLTNQIRLIICTAQHKF